MSPENPYRIQIEKREGYTYFAVFRDGVNIGWRGKKEIDQLYLIVFSWINGMKRMAEVLDHQDEVKHINEIEDEFDNIFNSD